MCVWLVCVWVIVVLIVCVSVVGLLRLKVGVFFFEIILV